MASKDILDLLDQKFGKLDKKKKNKSSKQDVKPSQSAPQLLIDGIKNA